MNHLSWKNAFLFAALSSLVVCQPNRQSASVPPTTTAPASATAPADVNPYYQTASPKRPEENRFIRAVITEGLNEPMELAVAPDGRVLFVDRTGALRRYNPANSEVKQINTLPVVEAEGNGLLGITLDPNFSRNNYVYLFYTPKGKGGKLRHQVSRFTLGPDSLDYASEKPIIEIPIEMESSAHTGGSLQFDDKGNLFISVGDNTTPFASDGFAPIDEREGRLVYDAQRSSGNTHDLRGKILRITVQPDGTYTVPDGNLFPKDGSKGRPEIYVMGCRNPYRMSVDPKTGFVYWGEIGPDSGVDGAQGPRGYDEVNQARAAGNYGWPYFVGDNKPYLDYNFATRQVGDTFRVARPVNLSPNNTGAKELPPAQKPLIWYPYNNSADFPLVKNGGRSAMAGPVYHFDPNLKSDVKFPAYYDGALFIFDWMRNWVFAVFMDAQGNYQRMERFMPLTQIDRPVDMQFGPEGALYLLEYGEKYGKNNPDAALVKITFNPNNRPPVALATASDTLGAAPLQVKLSGRRSFDFDTDDQLTYAWQIAGKDFAAASPEAEYTFDQPGAYRARLTVTDPKGQQSTSTVTVRVGNTLPRVEVQAARNRTFYFDNDALSYQVAVQDPEDGTPDPSKLQVAFSYLPQGKDIPGILVGHQQNAGGSASKNRGKELMANSDCRSCHTLDQRTVGPSFKEIAERYAQKRPVTELANKIIKGGGGAWGEHAMSAHPQLSVADAAEMVNYILMLNEEEQTVTGLPASKTIPLKSHVGKKEPGTYILTASYTDKGGQVIGPLTNQTMLVLRAAKVQAEEADSLHEGQVYSGDKGSVVGSVQHGSYLLFRGIDLTGIAQLTYRVSARDNSGTVSLHLDAPDGPVVSTLPFPKTGKWENLVELAAPLQATTGPHDLYFIITQAEQPNNDLLNLDWIKFETVSPAKSAGQAAGGKPVMKKTGSKGGGGF